MKRAFFVGLVVGFVFLSSSLFAHPPITIDIEYNKVDHMLSATIVHPVSNVVSHNVGEVEVKVNGRKVLMHEISKQDDNRKQLVIYRIADVEEGDVVWLEAVCNKSGKLAKKIEIK